MVLPLRGHDSKLRYEYRQNDIYCGLRKFVQETQAFVNCISRTDNDTEVESINTDGH